MTSPPPATYTPIIEDPPIINQHKSTKMWISISISLVFTIAALYLLYLYIKGLLQSQRQRQQQAVHFTEMTAALPRRIYHASGDLEENQRECSICLEEYQEEEELVELPGCHHLFHPECILNALRRKQECPFCRAQLEG